MANLEELTVDGYVFATYKDAELAKNEIKKIDYIEKHTDMTNLNIARSLYQKAIEERYFQTPIGLEYLRDIQRALENGDRSGDAVKPIPLYTTFGRINLNEDVKPRERISKAKKEELSIRAKYRNAVLIAFIFAFLCAGLLLVVINGPTPNAVNYKKAIINEYAGWEQEISDREARVREKEKELNIDY